MTSAIAWRAEDRDCPICGSAIFRDLGARGGRAHREGKGRETRIVRCVDCHGVYQRPTLLPMANPYEDYSAQEYFQLHDSSRKIASGEALASFAESQLGRVGTMLELGCGRGELLRGAANRGWNTRGVDMTVHFATFARDQWGIDVENSSIQDSKALHERHDVVVMAAILEHLYDPVGTLRRVRGALKTGGLVFIDVPNECSLMNTIGNMYLRIRGKDWATNLSPTFSPFHVVGFCPESLRRLLTVSGFEILSLRLYRTTSALPKAAGFLRAMEKHALDAVLWMGERVGRGAGISCWASRE
jgi:2-polyprenyl-3-methyl-5-hydroxy-6-metoxy-1,4-benzoquinol methylase